MCYHFGSFLVPPERVVSTLVVKNIPDELHERLRARARTNHRSVTQEAIVILRTGLGSTVAKREPIQLPPPIRLKGGPLTIEQIEAAIAEGRD
jgi:plasmid stability protein